MLALVAMAIPVFALRRLGKSPEREPIPELPDVLDRWLTPAPAHQLYALGDGEALLKSLPELSLHNFVPLGTALGRYAEVLEVLENTAPEMLKPAEGEEDELAFLLRINVAELLSELGRFEEARALVSKAVLNAFLDTGRRATLAWVLTLEGRAEEASAVVAHLNAAVLGSEYAAEVHLTKAFVMLTLGRLPEATIALLDARSAAVRASSVRNVLCLEAELAWRKGEHQAALRLFEAAAAHHWRWQGGHGLLRWGELLAELGRGEEAREAWTRCVAQDPESLAAARAKVELAV